MTDLDRSGDPGRWAEPADRPRYRVLARPFYDHPGSGDPDDPTGGHDAGCAAGHELTVYRVDVTWRELGGDRAHAPLGVTQVTGARLDLAAARATVVDYLRRLADPYPTRVGPADVELYLEVS